MNETNPKSNKRSRKYETKKEEEKKTTCCMPFCENNMMQLVNIQCTACKDEDFANKHYMCMSCYLLMLKHKNYSCPLDRSQIVDIDPYLRRLIDTERCIEELFEQFGNIMNTVNTIRSQSSRSSTSSNRNTAPVIFRRNRRTHYYVYDPNR